MIWICYLYEDISGLYNAGLATFLNVVLPSVLLWSAVFFQIEKDLNLAGFGKHVKCRVQNTIVGLEA